MATTSAPHGTVERRSRVARWIVRHPIAAFLVGAYGLGIPLLTVRTATTFATTALGFAFTYVALLGSALVVTWVTGGATGVERFAKRFLLWRFGFGRWAFVVLALPALTVAIAAVTGTWRLPAGGWPALVSGYLLQTFLYGALEVNLAEEGAWAGHVQTLLAARHGLLGGALLTAPLFVIMHLPLQLTPGWTWGSVAVGVAALAVIAPFFRYLIGETVEATGGSLLAAGILHASFNASGELGFPGEWQFLLALIVLTLIVGGLHRYRDSSPHRWLTGRRSHERQRDRRLGEGHDHRQAHLR
jgi:CAAX protease family protein